MALISCILIMLYYGTGSRFASVPFQNENELLHTLVVMTVIAQRERAKQARETERKATVSVKLSSALHVCCFSNPNRLVAQRRLCF